MTLDQERPATRQCPHCGCSDPVPPGSRECPCCGQGYGAQGLADHLPLPDEDARMAPAMLAAAGAVALAVLAAVALGPWALIAVVACIVVIAGGLALAQRS
jgi:hypothetical protein